MRRCDDAEGVVKNSGAKVAKIHPALPVYTVSSVAHVQHGKSVANHLEFFSVLHMFNFSAVLLLDHQCRTGAKQHSSATQCNTMDIECHNGSSVT